MTRADLIRALAVTAEVTATTLSDAAILVMAHRLCPRQAADVKLALERCQSECRAGGFSLSAVLERLEDGHLGPEAAWALVAELTEDDTIVWTDQIAEAWGVARGCGPDHVAARLAFVEVYRRTLATARTVGSPPRWWTSLGHNVSGRAGAILEAVACGRLPEHRARELLSPTAWPQEWLLALPAEAEPRPGAALAESVEQRMSVE